MSDFKTRLQTEKNELGEKLVKLQSFFPSDTFINLDCLEKSLLRRQERAMEVYLDCLEKRICNLITKDV